MIKTVLKKQFTLSVLILILMNCTNKENDFFTIDINSAKEQPLLLSDIADNIEAIELEMTDSSLVNIREISRIHYTGKYIVVCELRSIMIFDKKGKFLLRIGSVGQGPDEYVAAINLAVDIKNERLYILCISGKIICYDFEGNIIDKTPTGYYNKGITNYIYYANDNLLYLAEKIETVNENKTKISYLYTIGNNLSISDSLEIHKIQTEHYGAAGFNTDYMCSDGENTYLYFGDVTANPLVLDTLYQLINNQLIPYLNLRFNNKGINIAGEKEVTILYLYKSSRYVFCRFANNIMEKTYCFYYDIKTGQGYKSIGVFNDDIHTKEIVRIRPFDSYSNMFYYLYTNIDDTAKEEPNPTLYVGKLKK